MREQMDAEERKMILRRKGADVDAVESRMRRTPPRLFEGWKVVSDPTPDRQPPVEVDDRRQFELCERRIRRFVLFRRHANVYVTVRSEAGLGVMSRRRPSLDDQSIEPGAIQGCNDLLE